MAQRFYVRESKHLLHLGPHMACLPYDHCQHHNNKPVCRNQPHHVGVQVGRRSEQLRKDRALSECQVHEPDKDANAHQEKPCELVDFNEFADVCIERLHHIDRPRESVSIKSIEDEELRAGDFQGSSVHHQRWQGLDVRRLSDCVVDGFLLLMIQLLQVLVFDVPQTKKSDTREDDEEGSEGDEDVRELEEGKCRQRHRVALRNQEDRHGHHSKDHELRKKPVNEDTITAVVPRRMKHFVLHKVDAKSVKKKHSSHTPEHLVVKVIVLDGKDRVVIIS
mmetsp:Transcript_91411/g.167763  ORF Transcript_91411/g.167763 Transcript_91411/m.167763 type:complete len:278 (+) Transcript_91411:1019-1852(+)